MVPSPAALTTSGSVATTVEQVVVMEVAITALPLALTRLMTGLQDQTTSLTVTATTHPTPTPTQSKFLLLCPGSGSHSPGCRCSRLGLCFLEPSRVTRLRLPRHSLIRARDKDSDRLCLLHVEDFLHRLSYPIA